MIHLAEYIDVQEVEALVRRARLEDMGPAQSDVTSACLVPVDARASALVRARQGGRLAGAALLPIVAGVYDAEVQVSLSLDDGAELAPGATVARLDGSLRSMLALERVALNLLCHLSGVATLTASFVAAVRGTRARIYDTRKTLPGLRGLEKYAVACGGGMNHRMGLYDAVLIKDNHIAHVPPPELPTALRHAVERARRGTPKPKFVEVEVDTLEQLGAVLEVAVALGRGTPGVVGPRVEPGANGVGETGPGGIDVVLLDNMTLEEVKQAVALRDRLAPGVELEASGGVGLGAPGGVRQLAEAGVERIAVGRITHSAPVLDLGLDIT